MSKNELILSKRDWNLMVAKATKTSVFIESGSYGTAAEEEEAYQASLDASWKAVIEQKR